METNTKNNADWPELKFEQWKDTLLTVQLWTQIVGKIRLTQMPWLNHSWHVTLYVSARGLTSGPIPYGNKAFELEFDFQQHELTIELSDGQKEKLDLYPRTVADFYKELFSKLRKMGLDLKIHAWPNEVEPAIPFEQDETHKTYQPEKINAFWKALIGIQNIFTEFRAGYTGKNSPIHFFWGAFDLSVTRFSGRRAPLHPGGAPNMPTRVMQEAYSHEVSSCGFWPGSEQAPEAVFYAYCYPTPEAFGSQPVEPGSAFYSAEMGEFLLPYEDFRKSEDSHDYLLRFLNSTYEAAARTGNWDKSELECDLRSFKNRD